jgi:hypothetical protein
MEHWAVHSVKFATSEYYKNVWVPKKWWKERLLFDLYGAMQRRRFVKLCKKKKTFRGTNREVIIQANNFRSLVHSL